MASDKGHSFDTGPLAFALIIAAVLFSSAFYFAPQKTAFMQDTERNLLSVSAEAYREVAPDKAEMVFSVVSRGADPVAVQAENDAKLSQMRSSLLALGVPEANIKTVGYSLNRWTEYNKTQEMYVDRGYELRNSLRVVTYDVPQAGAIVKQAVASGANDVQSVQFMLSDSGQEKVYGELLIEAAGKAKQKAQSMASASGVQLGSLRQMSESYGYVEPMANYKFDAAAGAAAMPEQVSLSAGLVRVRATVSAQYGIAE